MSDIKNHPIPSSVSLPKEEEVYKVYTTRWIALALFSTLLLCNALMWVTFSPISDITQDYFKNDPYYGSTTGINMLANVFLILYTPGTFVAVFAMKYLKPRKSLLLAGVLTAFGAFLRYIATLVDMSVSGRYWLIFMGQAFGAIAQPMFLNFPPAIASIWFPVHERDLSTTIASMSSPIGNAIGSVIPVIFVTENNQDDDTIDSDVKGMSDLMLTEFIICLIPLAIAFFYFEDAPPTPPSHSTQLKLAKGHHHHSHTLSDSSFAQSLQTIEGNEAHLLSQNASEASSSDHNSIPRRPTSSYESFSHEISVKAARTPDSESSRRPGDAPEEEVDEEDDPMTSLRKDVHLLLNNKDYLILFFVFSIGVGFFNSIMTLLNQIVSPYGYSNDDAGTFGAVFIFAGLVGAGIGGYLMEKTKAYRTLLKGGILIVCSVVVLFLCMLFSNNFWPLTVSMALMGFFILPLLPIMMENCAECTYPVQEELSMGILFTGCNVIGLGFIFALQYLIDVEPFGPPPFTPSNVFFIGVLLVAAFILLFYHGEYKRLNHEGANTKLDDEDEEGVPKKSKDGEALVNPVHNADRDFKHIPSTMSSPIIGRKNTQNSDDCHLVRVGSQDNSNNSQLFTESSSAVVNSQNIWAPTASYSTQPRTSAAMPPGLQVLVHAARTPSLDETSPVNNNNNNNNELRQPLL